jgi:NDP-sugar pyrophosphorylase family protein
MNQLSADYYFDLTNIFFKDLFNNKKCWEVLGDTLKEYIKKNLKSEIRGVVHEGAYIVGDNIFIDEGTVVEPGAYITGPTIIGKNCEIRHGAYIRGNVLVGNGCVVGHATEIKSSIMLCGAKAGHFAYIGDSVLGNNVNLGAGTKLANLKIVPGNVHVKRGEKSIDSGLRKLGAIIGDHTEIGCNSVTSPGTLIGKNSIIYSCTVTRGFYPENSIVKLRQNLEVGS